MLLIRTNPGVANSLTSNYSPPFHALPSSAKPLKLNYWNEGDIDINKAKWTNHPNNLIRERRKEYKRTEVQIP